MNKEKTLAVLKDAEEAYNAGDPVMTDAEYDDLLGRAQKEWPTDKSFQKKKRMGSKPKGDAWQVVKHSIPMGSISNIPVDSPNRHVEDTLKNGRLWWEAMGKPVLLVQHKLDGLSINLEYQDGVLARALLRGDGTEGEDTFRNVIMMHGHREHEKFPTVKNIRAEIILSKENFAKVNTLQEAAGEKPYANCRNAAAGIARRLDGNYSKYLQLTAFDIQYTDKVCDTDALLWADKMGIPFVESLRATTWEQVERFYKLTLQERDDLPYNIDGLIVKADTMHDRAAIGGDSMLPNWARALKFPSETNEFRIDTLTWPVGKTGKLTPVVHNHAGVQFRDKVVEDVTLHNYSFFCQYKLAPGDKISVAIAGDVIPHIEEVLERSGQPMFTAPKVCPECNKLLRVDGTHLYCDAEGCPGRIKAIINAHIKEMGIEEVGRKLVEKLYTAGQHGAICFNHFPDLYLLTEKDLYKLGGYQEVGAKKVIDNIQKRKVVTFPVLIASLGIPNIGAKTIEKLGVDSVDALLRLSIAQMQLIDGIGPTTAVQIAEGRDKTYSLLGQLLANGVSIKQAKKVAVESNLLQGKSYCFTGELSLLNVNTGKPYTREEAQELVVAFGGVVKSGVSKKLDVLVLADMGSGSSKARKAREYGCETISGGDFFKRLGMA